MKSNYRFGFVSLIGRTNVGKSTLLNSLIGSPLSIVSKKPQTTRKNFRGILTTEKYQAVFVDTPGIHLPKSLLQKKMVTQAYNSPFECDLALFLIETAKLIKDKNGYLKPSLDPLDEKIIQKLIPDKCLLLINKIDLASEEQILKSIEFYSKKFPAKEIIPLSALKNKGIDKLKKLIGDYLPVEQAHYSKNLLTDSNLSEMSAEFVREQAFRILMQELPHGMAVLTEKLQQSNRLLQVYVCIYIDKLRHKKMIIGNNGEMLKKIGTRARIKLEKFINKKVFLSIYVKQVKNWQNKDSFLKQLNLM